MIDRQALEVIAAKHFQAMRSPNGVSLHLHLHNGETFAVASFLEFYATYCVAALYPKEALTPDQMEKVIPKDTEGGRIFDRALIPYAFIGYMTITAREPEQRAGLGFNV